MGIAETKDRRAARAMRMNVRMAKEGSLLSPNHPAVHIRLDTLITTSTRSLDSQAIIKELRKTLLQISVPKESPTIALARSEEAPNRLVVKCCNTTDEARWFHTS
jgi:hypothetical protein